jgi:hypothetical protein
MTNTYEPTQSKSFVSAFGLDYLNDYGDEEKYTKALEDLYPMNDDLVDKTQESLNTVGKPTDRDWLISYMSFYFDDTKTHLEWKERGER